MKKLDGYGVWQDNNKSTIELDSFTCRHCNTVVFVKPKASLTDQDDIGGFCLKCMKNICTSCVSTGECDPLEKKLERVEKGADPRKVFKKTQDSLTSAIKAINPHVQMSTRDLKKQIDNKIKRDIFLRSIGVIK